MEWIITIDGRSHSGKSSLVDELDKRLYEKTGIQSIRFSCGEYYRAIAKANLEGGNINQAMSEAVYSVCAKNRSVLIEGRTSALILKHDLLDMFQENSSHILLDVNQEVQMLRHSGLKQENASKNYASPRDRDHIDELWAYKRFQKNIFDQKNYDLYIDTSNLSQADILDKTTIFVMQRYGL